MFFPGILSPRSLCRTQVLYAQIVQEARLGLRLQHPCLIELYGVLDIPRHGLALVLELAGTPCLNPNVSLFGPAAFSPGPWYVSYSFLPLRSVAQMGAPSGKCSLSALCIQT